MRLYRAARSEAAAGLQFLRELHFIEAPVSIAVRERRRSRLQFLRELHFIEAHPPSHLRRAGDRLQFFRELHFTEAGGN